MAIQELGSIQVRYGTNADRIAISGGLRVGQYFFETDTGLSFVGSAGGDVPVVRPYEITVNGVTGGAIQAALDAVGDSGIVVLDSDQEYSITDTLDIPAGCTLDGNGATLKLANGAETHVVKVENVAVVKIRNLTIDGNYANQSGADLHGIRITGTSSHVQIEGVTAKNCKGSGILANTGTSHVTIRECLLTENGEAGIQLYGSTDAKIVGNRVLNNLKTESDEHVDGIGVQNDSVRAQVLNNTIVLRTGIVNSSAITVQNGCGDCLVDGNYCEGDGVSGLGISVADECDGTKVVNNTVIGFKGIAGIEVTGNSSLVQDILVDCNTVRDATYGVAITGAGGCEAIAISNNKISDVSIGIILTGTVSATKNLTIRGNTIKSTTSTGIDFTTYGKDSIISDNIIVDTGAHGIAIDGPTGCVINSNRIDNSVGYNIITTGSSTGNTIVGNILTNASVSALSLAGTNVEDLNG